MHTIFIYCLSCENFRYLNIDISRIIVNAQIFVSYILNVTGIESPYIQIFDF